MVNATPAPGSLLTDAEKAAALSGCRHAADLRRSMSLTGRYEQRALEAVLFAHFDLPVPTDGEPITNVAYLVEDHLAPRYVERQPTQLGIDTCGLFAISFTTIFLLCAVKETPHD